MLPLLLPLRFRDPTPYLVLMHDLCLCSAQLRKKLMERRRIQRINSPCNLSPARLPHHLFSPPSMASGSPR
ncbi:hypothetical protein MA16_Dca013406 [Dendrobium catenatum]|uniref:Uncharacterized protein n=1 Tax=Dendrobium catenatum TaxID=906689 RepID=A0A2I0X2S1_9ASPA|nr:hypothetical protein MA16_Dca013406 [Dendrobium catenatum]